MNGTPHTLLANLNLLASAPEGVARLRELILTLAVQGKLVPQDPNDEPASELLKKIRAEKNRLIAEGKIKRDKPLAEIKKEETPITLPAGWEWVRLNALLQKIGAGSTPLGGKAVYAPTGVKFLRSQNVWNDGLRLEGVAFIKPETHARMASTTVFPNDLLFNITGASIGRCAVVPRDFDEANVSQHVTIVRAVLPALNAFLHKVLVSRHVQQTVMDVQVGVSREGLSIAKLGDFLIPFPPLAEQARIVARVEELMRLCDALEAKGRLEATQHAQLVATLLTGLTDCATAEELAEHWQRVAEHFDLLFDRPEAVDALEQTILQLAVRGLLVPQDLTEEPAIELLKKIRAEKSRLITEGKIKRDKPLPPIAEDERPFELPQGWEWVRLRDLVTHLGDGLHGTPNYSRDGAYHFVNGNNLRDGAIVIKPETKRVDRTEFEKYKKPLDATTVLLSINGTLGNVAFYGGEQVVLGKSACYFNLTSGLAKSFLRTLLECPDFLSYATASATGSTIKNLGLKAIGDWPIALPPLAEQSRIVARVASLRALCADLRQRLTAARDTQAQLSEALVAKVS